MQWADNSSVKLLNTILNDQEIKYFFCIIAYRDNEIDKADLQSFERLNELKISNIKLENLKQENINSLISDTLSLKKNKLFRNTVEFNLLQNLRKRFFYCPVFKKSV